MTRVTQEEMIARILERRGVVAILGGTDTGKTSFAIRLCDAATSAGITAAYVDADVGLSTVGPPACVGMKLLSGLATVDKESLSKADALGFVGSVFPRGHLLSLVTSTAAMVAMARQSGCDLIVLDTSGYIRGVDAELLKYHKLGLVQPDQVIGFERGEELEPILSNARRFLKAEVLSLKVVGAAGERSAEERLGAREDRFRAYFEPPLSRWRVKPTVFMPALPPDFDLRLLEGLVVGVEDGSGMCLGIGVLEFDAGEDVLRMVSPVRDQASGLHLGSTRINTAGQVLGRVTLAELLSTG